ncbi:MAG: hypothetical protein Q8R88_00015 [Desulfoprunum sp.]|nr:hypothetical protein [Desulfoprunum sp.]
MRSQQEGNGARSSYAMVFTSALFLSISGILVHHLTEIYPFPPMILAFCCNFFFSVFLLFILELYYPFLMEIRRRDLGYLMTYGFLLAVFDIPQTASVAINGTAIVILLGWWFLDTERHGRLNPWTTLLFTFGFASLFLLAFNLLE